ncbi:MAG: single-stranded DNA-binding protein [Chloroflexi bacterium]|nr:single-stranded DNA-binding protein [Chloroflexota bacterium]
MGQVVLRHLEFEDMLRVTVMGNLGSDAQVRFSARENRIASFRIAVNQTRTNAAGQREENAEWFRVNVMGRQAEYASQLLKGQRVLVVGRLQIAHFQRQDGSPGVGFDVWADEIQNVGGRPASDSEDSRVGAAVGEPADEFPEPDLPF